MPLKKIAVTLAVVLVAIGGFVAGLALLRQRQEIREEAAVPGGQAQASLFPTSGNFKVGDAFPVNVFFNTANIAVSGVSVRLTYPYSGPTPEMEASDLLINSSLLTSGDWTCPTRAIQAQAGTVNIDIACANISASGFSSNTDTLLATFNLKVSRVPLDQSVTVRFDPTKSVITRKSDGSDILLVPTATGEYAIGGTAPTSAAAPTLIPTQKPTGATASPTKTPTATATKSPTTTLTVTPTASISATPTVKKTATPTAATGSSLPDAGISYPTIFAAGLGVLVIFVAILLAF